MFCFLFYKYFHVLLIRNSRYWGRKNQASSRIKQLLSWETQKRNFSFLISKTRFVPITNYTLLFQELFGNEFYMNWNCCFSRTFLAMILLHNSFFSGWFLRNIFNWTRSKSVGNRQCQTLDLIYVKRNIFTLHWINNISLERN